MSVPSAENSRRNGIAVFAMKFRRRTTTGSSPSRSAITSTSRSRTKLAANAEAAADMPFVQVNPVERQPEHRGERLAVVMRHLGSTIHPKDTAGRFRHGDRSAGFEWHAAVPADRQLQRYHRVRPGE